MTTLTYILGAAVAYLVGYIVGAHTIRAAFMAAFEEAVLQMYVNEVVDGTPEA